MTKANTPVNKNGTSWVDFKEVKRQVSMKAVLRHYGLLDALKPASKNLVGRCPIHKGSNPRQFSVDPEKNIFNCFGDCKSGGNILDFVAKMEEVSIRKAALLLSEWFSVNSNKKTDSQGTGKPNKHENEPLVKPEIVESINPPLTFHLKSLNASHPFFTKHDILPETVKYFELGYSAKGMMKDRVAIPIHNEQGELVAYCGRAVTAEQAEKEGKYKLPPKFVKSAVLYNLHRQKKNESSLILVESFLSVFRLYQAGLSNVVALMGSSLSEIQEELVRRFLEPDGKVILMFDADEAGEHCTDECLSRLSRRLFIKAVDVSPYAKKPHHLSLEQLSELLT